MTPKSPATRAGPDWTTPRPIDTTYWVVPGRLLVGEHPGSRSRAEALDRLRRFIEAGVTCFIDLTELDESPGYDMLLPSATPLGRRVEYLRQPILDHGVPADLETMHRILATLNGALESGHCVYLHCRAGIGRSATVAGCWLAERSPGGGEAALTELGGYWQQCRQSKTWRRVPETGEQAEFVRAWPSLQPGANAGLRSPHLRSAARSAASSRGPALEQRVRGGWFGLALGDALGAARAVPAKSTEPLVWSQHTALALGLAESLHEVGRYDARDQIERYWRWFKEGHLSATGEPGEGQATPDVAKALATFRWRRQPTAGSHDPKGVAATSLPRVLAAVLHAGHDPAGALVLAAECSRTTHQSPLILDACRAYSAMLLCALHGRPAPEWLQAVPEPVPGCWTARPLAKVIQAALAPAPAADAASGSEGAVDVVRALRFARRIVRDTQDFAGAVAAARRSAPADAALVAGLVGTVYGLQHGVAALPADALGRLTGRAQIEVAAERCIARLAATGGVTA